MIMDMFSRMASFFPTVSAARRAAANSCWCGFFLAHVSRAHDIEICPSSVRPCRNYLWTRCTDFFQILLLQSCCFSWAIRSDFVFYFLIFTNIICFVFVNIGPNGRKNFKTLLHLQIAAKNFETCPEFSSQWSSQNCVGNFWNFEFPIVQDLFSKISNSPL